MSLISGSPAAASSGLGSMLFDSTLGGSAASIDSGAGSITAGGYFVRVLLGLRQDTAGANPSFTVRVNNDSSAIYDIEIARDLNGVYTGGPAVGQTSWTLTASGAGSDAGSFTSYVIDFLLYDLTTFHKEGTCYGGQATNTTTSNLIQTSQLKYRSTTAISRIAVTSGGNFIAGSRMTVLKF